MNTQLRNTDFQKEVQASLLQQPPENALPFAYALVDGIRETGQDFLKSDRCKALLHLLNTLSHGKGYRLDGRKEHNRLEIVFSQ